jgi:hypothetical protein
VAEGKLTAKEMPACVVVSFCQGTNGAPENTYHAKEGRELGSIFTIRHGKDGLMDGRQLDCSWCCWDVGGGVPKP